MWRALAPAKVNLFLHVGAPAADGYHPLCSLMAFADFGDEVELQPSDALGLVVDGPFGAGLDGDDNLVLRAARALTAEARRPTPPVKFLLRKHMPVAAGLGGGSSDAGATLRLMRIIFGFELQDERIEGVAASLGADGAACLWAAPVIAQGRGERLSPAPVLPPELHVVLVNPGVPVSTPAVYRRFDELGAFGDITPPPAPDAFESVAELAAWLSMQRNDLEAAAIATAPEVGMALDILGGEPEALLARVSGSGGTCFALCAGDLEAETLAERVAAMAPHWWVRRCRLGGPWEDLPRI